MPTVFPENLIEAVIAADAVRRRRLGMPPAKFRPSQRARIEPFFNAVGWLWGVLMRRLPASLRRPFDVYLCEKMGGHAAEDNPELPLRISQTVDLAQSLYKQAGRWPVVFILTSHPETEGPNEWLRFELLRQGLKIAEAVSKSGPTPRIRRKNAQCFLAVDPYALDTLAPAVGGFYAAWMHQAFQAWDRQPSTQSWVQRHWFLRGSGYPQVAWRLLKRLRNDTPMLMALSGGLPHNARLLYTAREFIQRLPIIQWPMPRLEAQKRFMDLMMEPVNGMHPTEKGTIPDSTTFKAKAYLKGLGLDESMVEAQWSSFEAEFKKAVPNRERLFRVLKARFLKKGKPVLLIAISHRDTAPHVKISQPTDLASLTGHFVDGRY